MKQHIKEIRDQLQNELVKSGLPFMQPAAMFWYSEVQKERQQIALLRKTFREEPSPLRIAPLIDHTLLKPDATVLEIQKVCQEAIEHHFAAVCVNPVWISKVYEQLHQTPVKVCTVIGFPLGATTTETKVAEAALAIAQGAEELDMVIHLGALKAGDWQSVYQDIYRVVTTATPFNVLVKVILETALLTEQEIISASIIAALAGAAYVKTSTGFASGGATVEAVRLMAQSVEAWGLGVKASGGIRNFETAWQMITAGATRIGASASKAIIQVN